MLEIIFELENEYKIDIDDEIFSELKTIEDVVNYVIDLL
jgi:acyl carrier protein